MADSEGLRLILALSLGTLALLLMAAAIIAFVMFYQRRVIAHKLEIKTKEEAMQKELLRATIQSQEEEQRRIACDLHDDLGPILSAVKLKIAQLNIQVGNQNEAMHQEFIDSKEMLDVTISQVRGISHRLLPPLLEEYGLVTAIESSCEKMNSAYLQIQITGPDDYQRMPNETELALYRVIMELLNNVIKHSRATKAEINIIQNNSLYEIAVTDNGIGFDTAKPGENAGLGLKNIQSRLSAINASIGFESSPGNTVATIRPLPA